MQKQMRIVVMICSVLTLTAIGCKTRSYSGAWKGTTSQGKEFTFTVKGNAVESAGIAYKLDCKTGGFCPTEGSSSGNVDFSTIEADAFTVKMMGGNAIVNGKFESDATASGDLKVVAPQQAPCDCSANVKWTANKL